MKSLDSGETIGQATLAWALLCEDRPTVCLARSRGQDDLQRPHNPTPHPIGQCVVVLVLALAFQVRYPFCVYVLFVCVYAVLCRVCLAISCLLLMCCQCEWWSPLLLSRWVMSSPVSASCLSCFKMKSLKPNKQYEDLLSDLFHWSFLFVHQPLRFI